MQTNEGAMSFGAYGASAIAWAYAGVLATERWILLVGTYDGDEVRIYADGVLAASAALAGPIAERPAEVVLGARDAPSDHDDFWTGDLDEVRLWDRALLPEEIEQMYDEER